MYTERTSAMHEVVRSGMHYTVMSDGEPARSTLGLPLVTAYRLLAEDLCGAFNGVGPSPDADASLVALHSTYLDCCALVPRPELETNLLARYDVGVDVALNRPANPLTQALMAVWFGPVENKRVLAAWLGAASMRQLVSMQVCTSVVSSVLVPYRLLRAEIPASTLAAGLRKYRGAGRRSVDDLTVLLERVRRYATVPDEPDLAVG